MEKRAGEQFLAALRAKAAAEASAAEANRPVLMLPAPVEDPMMAQLNALASSHVAAPAAA